MEETYEGYLEKERKLAKPKISLSELIITILVITLMISIIYILIEMPKQDCEIIKNESLILGFNKGVEQWNTQVISKVNNDKVIPYYYNQTYYELNIAQICESV